MLSCYGNVLFRGKVKWRKMILWMAFWPKWCEQSGATLPNYIIDILKRDTLKLRSGCLTDEPE